MAMSMNLKDVRQMLKLLVPLAALILLVEFFRPKFGSNPAQARISAAQYQIVQFNTALNAFAQDTGSFPTGPKALKNLLEPANISGWKGPYLRQLNVFSATGETNSPSADSPGLDAIPLDPWGNEYHYLYPGKHNTRGFDILSTGPDGQLGTPDDIANYSR